MKFNQKGFTIVEGLLVVIAITLIVGVGFYIMNTSKDDTETKQSTTTTTKTEPADTKKQTAAFEFENLKVVVPEDDLGDLMYETSNVDGIDQGYNVSTQAFKDLAKQCGQTIPTGVFVYSKAGTYPGQGNEGFNGLLKQFSDGYVAYGDGLYGSVGCSETVYGQLSDMQEAIADKLKAAFAKANKS